MKVVWLCPYPINEFASSIKFTKKCNIHPAPWIKNLAKKLSSIPLFELHIITYNNCIKKNVFFIKENVYYHVLRHSFPLTNYNFPSFLPLDRLFWFPFLRQKIKKTILKINPDIIHSFGTETPYSLVPITLKYPHFISIQGIINDVYKYQKAVPYFFQKRIETYCIKNNKNFGCRTEYDKSYIQKINQYAKIYYFPEMISDIYFQTKWKCTQNHSIVFVGSIIKRKGIEELITAVNILKKTYTDIHLHIVGNGSKKYVDYCKGLIQQYNIAPNITFYGFLESTNIAKLLLESRIFILPSHVDNSPNSLCEAMAVGIPVIASRIGGIPSLITDYYDGLLFEKGNIDQLSKKIAELFDNETLAISLSQNARISALSRHTSSVVIESTTGIYKDICNETI